MCLAELDLSFLPELNFYPVGHQEPPDVFRMICNVSFGAVVILLMMSLLVAESPQGQGREAGALCSKECPG